MPISPTRPVRMPPRALRYETPPTTQPAPQSLPIGQTSRHRGDGNRFGAPTAHSRYRVARQPPPDNQQSRRRNVGQSCPAAATAPRTCANRRGCRASRVSASHRARSASTPLTPASLRGPPSSRSPHPTPAHRTQRVTSTHPVATCGLRFAPVLPSADAPVRAGRYASPSVRHHSSAHQQRPPRAPWHY